MEATMKNKQQPAFPSNGFREVIKEENGAITSIGNINDGMTLRDYFAAKAMQAILSNNGMLADLSKISLETKISQSEGLAVTSYDFADAMLKVRE